jgi:hypothetical protein
MALKSIKERQGFDKSNTSFPTPEQKKGKHGPR